MSVEREGQLTRFTCDARGCRANYEGIDGFASAWAEAKVHGWVAATSSAGAAWRHYCRECKRELGDD